MEEKDRAGMQALALVAQLGFTIACPMVVFIGGGAWLDGQLDTVPWFLFLGIFLGLLAAGGALYQLTKVPVTRRGTTKPAQDKAKTEQDLGTLHADRRDGSPEDE
jgi:hypothetical protein